MSKESLHIIDSHTEGEPTRIIISGGPDLGGGSVAEQAIAFSRDHDGLRRALCLEPRGHEAMVGGMLCQPREPDCACGVFFFNNANTIPMCVHGTIGLVATLRHLGKITPGRHRIETPAGVIEIDLENNGRIEVANVPSRVLRAGVTLDVEDWGKVTGDIAWGGNGFFLIDDQGPAIAFSQIAELTRFGTAVKHALTAAGFDHVDGIKIDHVEIFGPPTDPTKADSRNFVLCPGNAYDRSPCGTGVSAKLASLHASGKLVEGTIWRQAGILDTVFEGRIVAATEQGILPVVSGRAWILSESTHHFDPGDPFLNGIG
jgi:4-hydroxyproline epimerase